MLQYIIVIVILVAALAYAIRMVYRAITRTSGLCDGCQGCQLKELKQRCNNKKERELRLTQKKESKKFGGIK